MLNDLDLWGEWMEYKRLGDIATYINGYPFKPEDRGREGLPIIRIQDLTGNAYNLGFYNGKYPERIEINDGDILISWSASLGVYEWSRGKALLNQHIFKVVFDKEKIDKQYFVYAVRYKLEEMKTKAHGATMKHIVKKDFDNTVIPFPSADEQYRIAMVISKVAKIISDRQQQLQKLDELVKARFVEMFGEPIQNPMNWPVVRLKEVSTLITNGNTPKGGSENYIDSGIIFLRSQNVWRNRVDLDDVAYIDEATHRSLKKSSLCYKDILITKTGRINTENSSLGRAALFLGEDNTANINGHVYLIRLDGSIVPEFVVTILAGEAYRKYIRKVCVGGIDKRQINVDQVEDFPIIVPPYEMQKDFAEFRGQVDKSKAVVQKALDEAQLLFDSLMQKYFC